MGVRARGMHASVSSCMPPVPPWSPAGAPLLQWPPARACTRCMGSRSHHPCKRLLIANRYKVARLGALAQRCCLLRGQDRCRCSWPLMTGLLPTGRRLDPREGRSHGLQSKGSLVRSVLSIAAPSFSACVTASDACSGYRSPVLIRRCFQGLAAGSEGLGGRVALNRTIPSCRSRETL